MSFSMWHPYLVVIGEVVLEADRFLTFKTYQVHGY